MNSRLGLVLAVALGSAFSPLAATVNDGTTTNNLVQVSNTNGTLGAADSLNATTNGFLVATQSAVSAVWALRTVWYASDITATGGVYTVSADFQPASDTFANRGGVIGWLSLAASNGIALQVTPEDPQPTFRLSVIDFSADNPGDNDSFNHLFNTDGTPASETSGPALSTASPDYSSTNFATFQIAFSAPTPADLSALTNATAHITAKVLQATNAGGPQIPVSQTIELLTDLPRPEPALHRFGYFALWGSVVDAGDVIGYLDNLSADGAIGAAPNIPPSVTTVTAVLGPGTIEISWAAIGFQLQMKTGLSASTAWMDAPTNTVNINRVTLPLTSGNMFFRLLQVGTLPGGPTLAIQQSGNSVVISWPAQVSGYRLQFKTDLNAVTWTGLTTSSNQFTEPIGGGAKFYRLTKP